MIIYVFGCVCFYHLPPHERHKLSAQSVRCAFLGYNLCQKSFACYDPILRRTCISRNVILFENQQFFLVSSMSSPSTLILPLSHSYLIFIQSALVLNQVLCIQDAPAHSLFQWLTRYLILPRSRFNQLLHR